MERSSKEMIKLEAQKIKRVPFLLAVLFLLFISCAIAASDSFCLWRGCFRQCLAIAAAALLLATRYTVYDENIDIPLRDVSADRASMKMPNLYGNRCALSCYAKQSPAFPLSSVLLPRPLGDKQ